MYYRALHRTALHCPIPRCTSLLCTVYKPCLGRSLQILEVSTREHSVVIAEPQGGWLARQVSKLNHKIIYFVQSSNYCALRQKLHNLPTQESPGTINLALSDAFSTAGCYVHT